MIILTCQTFSLHIILFPKTHNYLNNLYFNIHRHLSQTKNIFKKNFHNRNETSEWSKECNVMVWIKVCQSISPPLYLIIVADVKTERKKNKIGISDFDPFFLFYYQSILIIIIPNTHQPYPYQLTFYTQQFPVSSKHGDSVNKRKEHILHR